LKLFFYALVLGSGKKRRRRKLLRTTSFHNGYMCIQINYYSFLITHYTDLSLPQAAPYARNHLSPFPPFGNALHPILFNRSYLSLPSGTRTIQSFSTGLTFPSLRKRGPSDSLQQVRSNIISADGAFNNVLPVNRNNTRVGRGVLLFFEQFLAVELQTDHGLFILGVEGEDLGILRFENCVKGSDRLAILGVEGEDLEFGNLRFVGKITIA
jgi:hypothetical protein